MGKKSNKVVDLKPETISEEQLGKVQNIVQAINKLHADIGKLEAQKHNVLHALCRRARSVWWSYHLRYIRRGNKVLYIYQEGESSHTLEGF